MPRWGEEQWHQTLVELGGEKKVCKVGADAKSGQARHFRQRAQQCKSMQRTVRQRGE